MIQNVGILKMLAGTAAIEQDELGSAFTLRRRWHSSYHLTLSSLRMRRPRDWEWMCRERICVGSPGACWPNVPTFGCRADMSPTCRQLSQPRSPSYAVDVHMYDSLPHYPCSCWPRFWILPRLLLTSRRANKSLVWYYLRP